MEWYQIWRVPLSQPEEDGPVQSVEADEDDGEGHPGHPLYVTVPHAAQGRGGGQGEGGSYNRTWINLNFRVEHLT